MKKSVLLKKHKIVVIVVCIFMVVFIFFISDTISYYVKTFPKNSGDYVILLHGLGRSHRSMNKIGRYLHSMGFYVININYPSLYCDFSELSSYLDMSILKYCNDQDKRIHFVAHSMGGILIRYYFTIRSPSRCFGRAVLLAPPNQGSEVIDHLSKDRILKYLIGPAGLRLGSGPSSLPNRLGAFPLETGVIAGDRSFIPVTSQWINGPNDGLVSVESALTPWMKDFLVLHYTQCFRSHYCSSAD